MLRSCFTFLCCLLGGQDSLQSIIKLGGFGSLKATNKNWDCIRLLFRLIIVTLHMYYITWGSHVSSLKAHQYFLRVKDIMKTDLCHNDREKKQRKKQSSLSCIKNIYKLVQRRIKKKKMKLI